MATRIYFFVLAQKFVPARQLLRIILCYPRKETSSENEIQELKVYLATTIKQKTPPNNIEKRSLGNKFVKKYINIYVFYPRVKT